MQETHQAGAPQWKRTTNHDPRWHQKEKTIKAAPQYDVANRLGGSDKDRGHKDSARNVLRKIAEEGQVHAKQACPRTPIEDGASLQQHNPEAKEAEGMEDM